ncbi:MAG: LysR family transcriptional regulator [Oscillospiraceae bacterium]|nr:LysR family transcriptional regulator [Oscillospiraceae bacterium]
MDLKELEYVVAIADAGGISRAAEKLFMAQSSLSQFLARYEAELGARLFTRTGGGVRLTGAGELFVRSARDMLRQYQQLKAELKEADLSHSGVIHFGISSFRGGALIPPVLQRFRGEYPLVDVVIHEHNTNVLNRKIAAGELDLALIALRPGETPAEQEAVLRDEVCLVVNRAHPMMEYVHFDSAFRPWAELRDAARFELLLSNPSTVLGAIAEQELEKLGLRPRAVNRDLTAAFAQEMACQGLGLAFSYGSCAVRRSDVEYVSLGRTGYFVDLILVFPPDSHRTRSVRALQAMIRDFYGGSPAPGPQSQSG